jgi:hypothetical protein
MWFDFRCNSILRLLLVVAAGSFLCAGTAQANFFVGRAGQVPPGGATDIDAFFTGGFNRIGGEVVSSGSTIEGNPPATITTDSISGDGSTGKAVWQGSMTAGNVVGWTLEFRGPPGPVIDVDWFFTRNGIRLDALGQPVPEPSTAAVVAVGIAAIGMAALRRKRTKAPIDVSVADRKTCIP